MAREAVMTNDAFSQADLPELLNQYYQRLFPYKLFYKWLSYGNSQGNLFTNREFSFTLKDDVYIRYLSFESEQDFEKEVIKRLPYKIDIGAVYNYKPKSHKTIQAGSFQPEEKELVFDIDMTDYDDVRSCCNGANICRKCWPLMTTAVKVIDSCLEEDFGFQHRLWVYSGRRGVHCWVADPCARRLTAAGRSAIAEYLSVIKGGESQFKKVFFKGSSLHPSLKRASKIVSEYFYNHFIKDQNILDSVEQQEAMLKLISDEAARLKVQQAWNVNCSTTQEKWDMLVRVLSEKLKDRYAVDEIMFQYVYPRLDINVSKGLNHLLKIPFCVHPKTGRVCVPIDSAEVNQFDPFTVPTVSQLISDLDKHGISSSNGDDVSLGKCYLKTALASGIKIFEKFVFGLEDEVKHHLKDENSNSAKLVQW